MNESVEFLKEVTSKPSTGRELLESLRQSGMVGIWKGRKDITDSVVYARFLRKQAQERPEE